MNFQLKLFVLTFFCVVSLQVLVSQDYPFVLPDEISATLTVDSLDKEVFKNQLLGYNIERFKSAEEKDFIRKFNPVSIRFPHGLWANYYQWQTDAYQSDSWDHGAQEAALATYVRSVKGDINEIALLNKEKKEKYGRGFNMMWTYSMNFDDAQSCLARAIKDSALGFEIKDIELGNEHFWKSQRSNQVPTAVEYLQRADSVAKALHARFPDVRVSIPLGWRRSQEAYNKSILGDKQYYDAISLHKYMGADPDVPGESNTAYSALLTSRLILKNEVDWLRSYAGDKPIWLTEWGVKANSDVQVNSAAALGMADVYLHMSENQHIYDRANWFIFNKALNPMVVVDSKAKPVYPLQKRAYLSVYEMLQEVFMDGQMLASEITSTPLTTGMNAVNARIVQKDGVTKVMAINLADKAANFQLKFGDTIYSAPFAHHALAFEGLVPVPNIGIDADAKELIKSGTGQITLPPLSLNIITLMADSLPVDTLPDNDLPPLRFINLTDGQTLPMGVFLNIRAEADRPFEMVELWSGDQSIGLSFSPPYSWGMDLPTYMAEGAYVFKLVAFDNVGVAAQTSITVYAKQVAKAVKDNILLENFEDGNVSKWGVDGNGYGVVPTIVEGDHARSGRKALALEYSSATNGHHLQNMLDNIVVPFGHYVHIITHSKTSNTATGYGVPTMKLDDWAPTPTFTSHPRKNEYVQKDITFINSKKDSSLCFPRLRNKAQGGACTIFYDDIVMYTDNSYYTDVTPPSVATNFTVTRANFLRWLEGTDYHTGIKSTLVLRTTNAETPSPQMLDQVNYSPGDSIGEWVLLQQLAAGVETYKDTTESALNYTYAITHRDVAYNYSKPVIVNNGVTAMDEQSDVSFKCVVAKKELIISDLPQSKVLKVYTISGQVIFSKLTDERTEIIPMAQGVYLLQVDRSLVKVVVK